MNPWSEFTDDEYAENWDRVYSDLKFKPDYHERSKPAISEPRPSVTFDLSANLTVEKILEINDLLLDSFRAITEAGHLMYWLDWQHTCYSFDPQRTDGTGPISWYPDGDYYLFLASDFSFGTFGHPWQESLCVFGESLLKLAEQAFRETLTVLRESRPNEIG